MKPSRPFLQYLLKDGLTPTTRPGWLRSQHAAEHVDPVVTEHGHHIFIYKHIRTNQIIYSFTRSLNNHDALKQLPFLGKKTVPARLRKDLWLPFALVEFPSPLQGLDAFRRLREFRRLHETSYPLDLITVKEGKQKGKLMDTKERGAVLMDQKANSVADLAAVLLQDEKGPSEEQARHKERSKRYWDLVNRQKVKAGKPPTKKHINLSLGPIVNEVRIRWADPMDAEYAKTWPQSVVHHSLERSRYTAAFPAYEMVDVEEGENETTYAADPSQQQVQMETPA
ncbi:MAG: hypothetical protein Q9195_007397 [Heterodermia aff. obscurata]